MSQKDTINEMIKKLDEEKFIKDLDSKIIKDFLVIDTGENLLGIQIEYLREVFDLIDKDNIVSIPFTPAYILGVTNVRGEIIPVISLTEILGLSEERREYNKIAIIDDFFKIAVPFHDIIDLKTMNVNDLKPLKDASKKIEEQFLIQEFEFSEMKIRVVDIHKIYVSHYLA